MARTATVHLADGSTREVAAPASLLALDAHAGNCVKCGNEYVLRSKEGEGKSVPLNPMNLCRVGRKMHRRALLIVRGAGRPAAPVPAPAAAPVAGGQGQVAVGTPAVPVDAPACAQCASTAITERSVVQPFIYGVGDAAVPLSATVIVITCADCHMEFTDYRAEEARDAAVRAHLAAKG